jgi:hypothetical protein
MISPDMGSEPLLPAAAERLAARVVLAAVFVALPELLLVNLELWLTIAAAIWAVGGLLHLAGTSQTLVASLIAAPGLWISWWTLRMAVANRIVDKPSD